MNSVLKDLTTASNESWKHVEQYQNNYKRLVTNYVDLKEEIGSNAEKLEKFKNEMQNAQNVQNFHEFEKKSLQELNEQKKKVEHMKLGLSELSLFKLVENSLNKAIDSFSQSKNTGSSQLTASSSSLTRQARTTRAEIWQLRDIRKGSATTGTFEYNSQFCSQTQEVFATARDTMMVFKVLGESITMDRKLSFQGVGGKFNFSFFLVYFESRES